MNKDDFLAQLDAYLYTLTTEERESAVSYYREYLEEAGADACAAMEALGSPQSVAERIIQELNEGRVSYAEEMHTDYSYISPDGNGSSPSGNHLGRTILVICLTFPIWITILSIWFAVAVSLLCIPLAFAAVTIAAPVHGIMNYADGMPGQGLWYIGIGITSLGILLLLWKLCWNCVKYSALGIGGLIRKCVNLLMGRE